MTKPLFPVVSGAEICDVPVEWPIVKHEVLATGNVTNYLMDHVASPDGLTLAREYIAHYGAVAIIAVDDEDRVVVVHQYRHPVRSQVLEPPAGLLDLDDESYLDAAKRELAEETGVAASDWRVLVDLFTTPGACEEAIRVFLARGLTRVPRPEGFVLEGEEADMAVRLVPLQDLVEGIYAGRLQGPTLVSGILAAADKSRWGTLRPADAPWPARKDWESRRGDGHFPR